MDAYMIGRYCGTKAPYPIVSSANQLYMVFKSDSSVQRKGFHASHVTGMKYFVLAIKDIIIHDWYMILNKLGHEVFQKN